MTKYPEQLHEETQELKRDLRYYTTTFTRQQILDNHKDTLLKDMQLYVMEDREYRALPLHGWQRVIQWWADQIQEHTLLDKGLWCWGKALGLTAMARWYLDIDGVGAASDFSSEHGYAVCLITNDDKKSFRYGIAEPWAIWEIDHAHQHHLYKMESGLVIF